MGSAAGRCRYANKIEKSSNVEENDPPPLGESEMRREVHTHLRSPSHVVEQRRANHQWDLRHAYSDWQTIAGVVRLNAARESRTIVDTARSIVYMVGLGHYDLMRALPPGTQQFDCVQAPSGHLMLPCVEFPDSASKQPQGEYGS